MREEANESVTDDISDMTLKQTTGDDTQIENPTSQYRLSSPAFTNLQVSSLRAATAIRNV